MKILLLLLLLSPFATYAQPEKWADGRIIVAPRAGLPEGKFAKIIGQHGGGHLRKIGQSNIYVVETLHGSEKSIVARLAHNPHIKFAELDMEVEPGFVVNDPYYPNAWHLPKIGTPGAWDISRGKGVTVAVLDSGVDPLHPDLSGQLAAGWNFYDNNSNTSDVYGHGTKVAGVVTAVSNNSRGVASVSYLSRVMPIRVTNTSGAGYFSMIAQGIIYAADRGVRVANASFLGLSSSASVRSAAQYMKDKGGLVIVSGGNTGALQSYAVTTSMIPVAATDVNDNRASWSSYGNYIALSAPGTSIWTTTKAGGYGAVSGTSFSSPLTAGVVALMMSSAPALSSTQIEKILFSTAVDRGAMGRDLYYGYGRVDAAKAVQTAYSSSSTPAMDFQTPTVSIASPEEGSTVSGLVPVDVHVDDNTGVSRAEPWVNRTSVAVDTIAPFAFTWDTTGALNGENTLMAVAFDEYGNSSLSEPVVVDVSNPTATNPRDTIAPTVKIVNPIAGPVSRNVTVTVNAYDDSPASGITLQIYVDNILKASGMGSTLSYNWNTKSKNVSEGSHVIKAIARDLAGNTSSTTVNVTK